MRDRSADLIADEAADWVVRLNAPDVPGEDHRQFVAWLKRSPLHVSAYLQLERTWTALAHVDAARRIDVAALLAEPDTNVVPLGGAAAPKTAAPTRVRRLPIALAAAALLACVGLVWLQLQSVNRYATGVGEQRTLKLSDGSTVVLNTRTAVRVRFSDAVREVQLLNGEALFNVTKSATRPFRVRSDDVIAQAVGTSFVVRRTRADTVVTVIEGKVAIVDRTRIDVAAPGAIPGQAVHVPAGVRADVAHEETGRNVRMAAVDNPAAVTAWRSGRLVFDGEPLAEVLAEFNRYNDVQLVLEDSQLSGERISGVFDADQPLALARFLERSGAIEPIAPTEPQGGRIVLVPHR